MTAPSAGLAQRVVRWQRSHGRHDLPWQNTQDPYRVWLSEIMLQQTQVVTVMGYYARFLNHFPTVSALAAADVDEVLGLWSGLGYYSRARNLHRCAQQVMALHQGVFPETAETLMTLPGIGRSTAAAIASLCFKERVAILDGNVRRVLSRALGFDADLSLAVNERQLWALAATILPDSAQDMPSYTQGVMDLGATVCTRRKPLCERCPLKSVCVAKESRTPERFPVKTRKLKRTAESHWLLWVTGMDGAVWLEQRPDRGVWARLYALPMFDNIDSLTASVPKRLRSSLRSGVGFTHVLTHKDLHLHPVQLEVSVRLSLQREDKGNENAGRWVEADEWPKLGLPAPIRKLLEYMQGGNIRQHQATSGNIRQQSGR